jgi:hypothetical protein
MESKRKCKSDNEAKKRKDKTLDAKIVSRYVARWYERSSSRPNIPLIFLLKVKLSVDILL